MTNDRLMLARLGGVAGARIPLGCGAAHLSCERPVRETADLTLMATPLGILGFMEIAVVPNRIGPETESCTYVLAQHRQDRAVLRDEPVRNSGQAPTVDGPSDMAPNIRFIPLWCAVAVRDVFVDVSLAGPDNRVERFERLSFSGADTAQRLLSLSIRGRSKRDFTFRATLAGADSRMVHRPPETTRKTLIGIPG